MRATSSLTKHPVCVALLAAGVLSSSGCSTQSQSESPATATASQKRAASVDPIPDIQRLQVVKLAKVNANGNNGRLLATVSPNSTDVIKQGWFTMSPDPSNPKKDVTFTDDGKGADDTAGDLVFSGFVTWDFTDLLNQNARIKALGGSGRVTVTQFDGRIAGNTDPAPEIDGKGLAAGAPVDVAPAGLAAAISVNQSLIINDPGVVGDPTRTFSPCLGGTPMGPWTFGNLFSEIVNQPLTGNNPGDVAEKWLDTWLSNQELHFSSATARLGVQPFINDWRTASGGGSLDISKAPFRLVAIVNRMDLHSAVGYSSGSSGETRFVFALEDASCNALPFLVIFEYGNLPTACTDMTDLARKWVALAADPVGSAAYNTNLQAITDPIVTANAAPSKPNGSALNQLRTNDRTFDSLWQLREFAIDPGSGILVPDTVKRTPDISLDSTAILDNAIDSNLPTVWPNPPSSMPNILTGSFDPIDFPSGTFIRAMAADVPSTAFCFHATLAGNSAISADDARFEYSSNTCSGCHGGDINSGGSFTHISETGGLSPFLTGPITVSDCMTSTLRNFDEPTRRAQILDALANDACERLAMLKKLESVH